ncbi:hypothetical protein ACFY5K_07950 [Streptomyces griseofuscus]|uniref:hypothetical protein n=1 Tax=Streptomyces griseofuscus TaxID=146922 RepID=UPI00340C6E77
MIAALAAHGRLLVAAGHLTAARGALREALAAQGRSSSFRKLGVRRRTELAGRLAAEPAVPDR